MITHEIYNLGRTHVNILGEGPGPLLTYDLEGGNAFYSDLAVFECTAFLLRLAHQQANGPHVNCDDCAAAVSTFANVLGCDLAQAWLGDDSFSYTLNPVLIIGSGSDGWTSMAFNHHAVAWTGACDVDDYVFDACLMVDGDVTPGSNSNHHTELLPANLRFGRVGQKHYQWRLVLDDQEHIAGSAPKRNRMHRRVV
jgi:hypothetical protein